MGKKIKGRDFVLYLEKGGENTPVCCGTELSISITSETIEATKAPNSRWKNYISGHIEYSVSSAALVTIGEGVMITDIYNQINLGLPFEFVAMAENDKDIFYSGKIIINALNVSGGTTDLINYTMTATGDGQLNIINPYAIILITDEFGNPIEDGDGNPIYTQEHGSLNPIDLETIC